MVAAVGTANEIHIIRNTPTTQATDLAAGGDFSAPVAEAAWDKLTKLCIENADQLNHYLVDLESLVAGVDFQAYSAKLATLSTGTLAALQSAMTGLSAFAITYMDDTTAVATRTTLGAFAVSEMLCHDGSVLVHEGEVLTWQT